MVLRAAARSALSAVLCAGCLLATAGQDPASASVPIAATDLSDEAGLQVLAGVRFDADAGVRYLVSAKLRLTDAAANPASVTLVTYGLRCSDARGSLPDQGASESINLTRGEERVLRPRTLLVVKHAGRQQCRLHLSLGRPREQVGPNVVSIAEGASLGVEGPLPAGARLVRPRLSVLLAPGATLVAAQADWIAPAGAVGVRLLATVHVTACTAVAGSRDETTNGRQLCAGYKMPVPSSIAVRVRIARRVRRAGCSARAPADRPVPFATVDADRHHDVLDRNRSQRLSTDRACSRRYRLSIEVTAHGTPLVIHAPGTFLIAIPKAPVAR